MNDLGFYTAEITNEHYFEKNAWRFLPIGNLNLLHILTEHMEWAIVDLLCIFLIQDGFAKMTNLIVYQTG